MSTPNEYQGAGDSEDTTTPVALEVDDLERFNEQKAVRSLLVFPVADYGLIFETQIPMEFVENHEIYSIPSTHEFFLGLTNRRGNLVPVYDIRIMLASEGSTLKPAKSMLILGQGDDSVGIVLDGTPVRMTFNEEHRIDSSMLLLGVFTDHLQAVYQVDAGTYVDVNLDKYLEELKSSDRFNKSN